MFDSIVKDIIKNKFNSENWVKNKYPDFYYFIFNRYYQEISWKEKFYLYVNNLNDTPKCYCGNDVKFIKGKYRKYCSTKCMSNDPFVKNKKKNTCIEKYGSEIPLKNEKIKEKIKIKLKEKGVDNVSQLNSVKEKVKETNLKKYGVEYISQLDINKDKLSNYMKYNSKKIHDAKNESIKLSIKNKIKDYNLDFLEIVDTSLYSLYCNNCKKEFVIHKTTLNDRLNNKNIICTSCNPIYSYSDGQNQLFEFIKDNYNGTIIKNDRTLIKKELDIYLPELNLAFEYNGLYWHSEVYKETNYHLDKTNDCLKKGIRLIHIWEDDWLYKNEIVKSIIFNLLGKSNKIGARKCEIKIVNNKEYMDFVDKNHLQGYVYSKYVLGLYYQEKLVSIMSFGYMRKALGSKPNNNEYELLRYCSCINTSVIGGPSKLLKYFIKNYNPNKIISYADRTISNGNLYTKLGFNLISITKPNYYYVINGIRKNRFTYRKDVLVKMGFDINKTEKEIMLDLKYYRIYNSGNFKFELVFE